MASFLQWILDSGLDSLAVFLATFAAAKFIVWWSQYTSGSDSLPAGAVRVGHVTALHLYPVKSVSGFQLTEAQCTTSGLQMPAGLGVELYDRRWMVTVGSDCRFVTARQKPQLLTIKLTMDDNNQLCFTAPGMNDILRVPLEPNINTLTDHSLQTKVFGQSIHGWDCGDEAAEWFSRFLNEKDHRLLYNPGVGLRELDPKYSNLHVNNSKPDDRIAYQDAGPFLVVNTASLDDLNEHLVAKYSSDVMPQSTDLVTVTMDNFRPSITVSGESPAFDEDTWDKLFIGGVKMTQFMPCGRCMLTTIDPVTGQIRKDGEPLKTLRSYRMVQKASSSPCFGGYFVCDRPGPIRVGDPVFAVKRSRLIQ